MSSLAIIAIYMTRIVLAISMTQMVKRIVTNHTTITDEFSCPMLNAASVHRNSSEVAVNDLMVCVVLGVSDTHRSHWCPPPPQSNDNII